MRNKLLIFSFLIFILIGYSNAQDKKSLKYFLHHEKIYLLGNLGLSNYYGDLTDKITAFQMKPSFGLGFVFNFNSRISSKTEFNYVKIFCDDYIENRSLDFRSNNQEVYTSLLYNLIPYNKHFSHRRLLIPYVFGGVGFVKYNPQGLLDGKWYDLRSHQTEGISYGNYALTLPLGAGFKIKFSRPLFFMAEAGYRFTNSDYLDDVSNNYISKKESSLIDQKLSNRSDKSHKSGTHRGNSKDKDGYFVFSFKVVYVLGHFNHFKRDIRTNIFKGHHKRSDEPHPIYSHPSILLDSTNNLNHPHLLVK